MRIYTFLMIAFFGASMLNSQSLDDALRYSNISVQGTASSVATGNSFNALGADITGISMNPAGIAGFRNSYFVITPAYVNNSTSSYFKNGEGRKNERNSDGLHINSLGLVFSSNQGESRWKQSNFAIGLNKLADYNQTFYYEGKTVGTIIERFKERANGKATDDLDLFEGKPAYETYAINPDNLGGNNYISDIEILDTKVQKNQKVVRSGSMTELGLAWGGSYDNKLDMGFSIGIPFVSFEEVKEYNETDEQNEINVFNSLYYKEYLSTTGTGINIKAGVIYKIQNILRLGFTVQSPTWLLLKDEYYTDMNYKFEWNNEQFDNSHESPIGSFKYKMATPWSFTGSVGKLFRSGDWNGFVNIDVDFKNYKANRFNLQSYSDNDADKRFQEELNDEVDHQLGFGVNYRLGGEIAYKKARLRLGYSALGSPYKIDGQSSNRNIYSVGTGFRFGNTYLDFAYQVSNKEEGYNPYLVLDANRNQLVNNDTRLSHFAMTVSFNF